VASVDIVVLSDTVHQRELDHQVKIIKETATQHFCSWWFLRYEQFGQYVHISVRM